MSQPVGHCDNERLLFVQIHSSAMPFVVVACRWLLLLLAHQSRLQSSAYIIVFIFTIVTITVLCSCCMLTSHRMIKQVLLQRCQFVKAIQQADWHVAACVAFHVSSVGKSTSCPS